MKKKSLLLIVSLILSAYIADAQMFKKGDGVLNLTLGIGNALNYWGNYSTTIPPLAVSYETGILDNVLDVGSIGIGGYFGFVSGKSSYLGYDYYKYTNIVIGPRGTFHYPFVDKLDTYAGLMIAYNIVRSKWIGQGTDLDLGNTNSGLISSGFIGARYYFNENVAGVAELGWGVAYFNIGVAVKIK